MHSQFVAEARKHNPIGIWLPPEMGHMRDVSGNNRHAVRNSASTTNRPNTTPDLAGGDNKGQFGGAGTNSITQYTAQIPSQPNNRSTYMARIMFTGVNVSGSFMTTGNGGPGLLLGVGNGGTFETVGTLLGALNSTIAWHFTATSLVSNRPYLIACVFGTGSGNMRFFVDGTFIQALTVANMSGSPTEMNLGGHQNTSRAWTGQLGTCAYFDKLLSDIEVAHLYSCLMRRRV